ncbi:MAG: inorganic phosphate transporter, PiT family [Actinomycetota bacterium]|nr:inorganic phosphate transporter, PiT family [Actinomycetota bacterium]
MEPALLALVIATALVFAWTNGFHDAANAVATPLATGALRPGIALALSAVLNVVGGLLGVSVAQTLQGSLFEVPVNHPGMRLVLAALLAAIAWNLVTWWFGLPSSSSHALVGGIAGAGLAAGAGVDWGLMCEKVLLPTLVSPVIGFVGAWLFTWVLMRATQDAAHGPMLRRFRIAQVVSASAMALGHGLQDAQKTAGVVLLALIASGHAEDGASAPMWVRLVTALALGAGTAFGGWRIIRTLGRRITDVHPVTGFAAEAVAAGALYTASGVFAVPVSSTHVLVASIMGSGATRGLRAIHWPVIGKIAVVFAATPFATAALASACYQLWRLSF